MWFLLTLLACPPPEPPPPPPEVVVEVPEPAPLPAPTEPRYAATHVLIAWTGAVRARPGVARTEDEARELATLLRDQALAGEDLEELARVHSDGPSGPRGGSLGVYLTGTMVPEFEAAVASVEPGEIGPLVRTPFGYHVVRRDAVVQIEASHLLVSWDGALRSDTQRTREEAQARILEARTRLEAGEAWDAVVAEYSDCSTAQSGGNLGVVAPGQMVPAFEDAAFALEPGQISDVVETPWGFHLVRRDR